MKDPNWWRISCIAVLAALLIVSSSYVYAENYMHHIPMPVWEGHECDNPGDTGIHREQKLCVPNNRSNGSAIWDAGKAWSFSTIEWGWGGGGGLSSQDPKL